MKMKMIELYGPLSDLTRREIDRSIGKYGPLHSAHEAYAVILEEIEEAEYEMAVVKDATSAFWHCVKKDVGGDSAVRNLRLVTHQALLAACELIQVAAMARKFVDQEENGKPE